MITMIYTLITKLSKGGIKAKNKRLYNIWSCMKQRCNNPNNTAARWYHNKGIRVCKEWFSYDCFQEWALSNGYRDDLTIDRIDSDKNYCPENCQWIPLKENVLKRKKGGVEKDLKYIVWECERFFPYEGMKMRVVGIFSCKQDAKKAAEAETEKLRSETLKIVIESGQDERIIEKVKKRDTWLKYMYVIEQL